jgi:Ca2+-binding RTX toxin-like protein
VTTSRVIDLSFLTPVQGFIIQGDIALDQAGWSVSSAGDVNGDGIDDVIVGVPRGDDGGDRAGEAYVIYGVAGAARGTVDLTGLDARPADGFIIQGDAAGDWAGYSVSSAGDVNGDGLDDLIIGAPYAGDGSGDAGEAYVIYGVAGTSRGTLDLTALTAAQGFIIRGEEWVSSGGTSVGNLIATGWSVSSAGDVNGDGLDDLIVGAPAAVYSPFSAGFSGDAYVIYGVAGTTRGMVDLAGFEARPAEGFVILGDAAFDYAGRSVSAAGDVNGDGLDDLIVGASYGDDGGDGAGEAYVIYGVAGATRGTVDLTGLAARPADGFIIQGDAVGDRAGWSVSSAGDVNGDGLDDLIVGAPRGDDGGDRAGEAYVIYGLAGATRGTVDLTGLDARPADGFIIQGDAAGDRAGWSVSSAGDVNADGIEDLIVGALGGSDGGLGAGEAYVIYGVAGTARGTVDLTGLAAADGFSIQGDSMRDYAGRSVSAAGDVNGDGVDDLIVGATGGDDGGNNAGEAYVIYGGSASGFGAVVDLSTLRAPYGFIIQGDAAGDRAGWSVSSAGDVNGDGIEDVIVGAPRGDDGGDRAGEAYVIYGVAGASRGLVDLTALTAAQGFVIQGDAEYDQAGFSVSSAADVNGDGIDDLIVGARYGNGGGNRAGEAYVIYGVAGTSRGTLDLTALTAAQGFIIQGDAPFDEAGWSVSSAGDVNGDGIEDVIVGAPLGSDGGDNAGEAYVIYGVTGTTRGTVDLTGLAARPAEGFIIQGDAPFDTAGFSVSSAGDVNGDGLDDLIVGAPSGRDGGNGAGEAYVIYGVAGTSRGTLDLTALTAAQGFIIQGDAPFDEAGRSVSSAGDVNGDGLDDLIVGAPGGDDGDNGAGEAYVIYGVAGTARGTVDLTGLAAADGFIIRGDAAGDRAGRSVSSAGDVNGDGIDDLIVGAIFGDDGGTDAGEAYVIFGVAGTARGTVDLAALNPTQGFIIQGDAAADEAGWSVSAAGDVNGDGIDDLIVGARYGDDGGDRAGEAYVIYGRRPTLAVERTGTEIGQVIFGGLLDDTINGLGGNDTIDGGAGADSLDGGTGLDTLDYSRAASSVAVSLLAGTGTLGDANGDTVTGFERVVGSAFHDTLVGGLGNDTLTGGAGADSLDGGAGADSLEGGAGDDTYVVDDAGDVVLEAAGAGDDRVIASVSHTLGAGVERLTLSGSANLDGTGNALANRLEGNAGANLLDGGAGADTMAGGAGSDTYLVEDAGDVVEEAADEGYDHVFSSVSHTLGAEVERLTLSGSADLSGTGNALDNLLDGNAGANTLDGGAGDDGLFGDAGNDTLIGGLGHDTLDGGTGTDSLEGGAGDDTYVVDTLADVIVEAAGAGYDRVIASMTYTLGAELERLSLSGTADLNGTGNAGANQLDGNAGANLLNGGAGADIMAGGAGNDTYVVDDAGDVALELAGEGNDRVIATVSHTLGAEVERLSLSGSANLNGTGNAQANRLDGNAGANILDGGEGNDSLYGGAGADMLIGGAGNDVYGVDDVTDVVVELASEGYDRVIATISYTLGAEVERLSLSGSANLNGTGNALANRLDGNAGANILDGGEGDDALLGGAGADMLIGGVGNDTYGVDDVTDVVVELAGEGYDRVVATISYTLGAELERLSLSGSADLNGTGNALANRLDGNAGANILDGGAGDDALLGGAGADMLIGGVGNDTYGVDDVTDVVVELAGEGYDRVVATISYTLGAELERLSLSGSADLNGTGNAQANRLDGNAGANILDGGEGSDALFGLAGDDTLIGGGGNDTLDGGLGADSLEGGAGNDTYILDDGGDVVLELAGGGYDRVITAFNWQLTSEFERLSLTGTADVLASGNDEANRLDGNAGANVLFGAGGNDVLYGLAGDDTLAGGDGNDTLDGGLGADSLEGGAGNDTYILDGSGDVMLELADGGYDRIITASNWQLAAEFEWLSLSGTADVHGSGNHLANRLDGNAGGNILFGAEGNDALNGLGGNDLLVGDVGNDLLDGGLGADILAGGLGADRFLFRSAVEAHGDVISDFSVADGDRIDLRPIDTNAGLTGDQGFTWIGDAAFDGVAGQLRFASDMLEGDLDGNGLADFQIALSGVAVLTTANIWL